MATSKSGQVTKIYELRTLGYDSIHKELQQISKDYDAIKKSKREAEAGLASATSTAEASKFREELRKIRIEEAEIRKQRQQMMNEAKAEQIQRQASINQAKDLNREESQRAKNAKAAAGSYQELYNQYRQLYNLVKSAPRDALIDFGGQNLSYDEAIQKLKALATAEQDFRRQFARDQTLVGEYTTGIVQAFKQMGLGDLVGGQITKVQDKINGLNSDFESLRQELDRVRASGVGDLDAIEQQMIQNRREAIALNQQVSQLQAEFRGAGDVGNQIGTSIGKAFENAKGQITQMVLGYIGFQALLSQGTASVETVIALDSLDAALRTVSGSERELAINQQFLAETTNQLGLEYLGAATAFKGFYAASTQAGISADETRRIFFSAASASAALKLSQQDTNGVLLAFSQIASKGKVQAEELRGQIGERVPGAFAIAAKAIGKTQAELNKMLENGEVIASDFLPKFATQLQKTFGGDSDKKVEGLQASINRLKNQFTSLLDDNQGRLTALFAFLISAVGVLIGLLPALITLGTLLAANWAVQNAQLLLLRGRLLLYNLQLGASYILMGILKTAQIAYNALMVITTAVTNGAARAMRFFGISVTAASGPLGILLAIIGVVALAFTAFGRGLDKAASSLDENIRKQRALVEVTRKAADQIAEESGELNKWFKVATSASASADSIRFAKQKLIDQFPEYFGHLKAETASVDDLTKAYNNATAAIRQKAFATASADLAATAQTAVNQVAALEFKLDTEFANRQKGRTLIIKDLSDEEVDILNEAGRKFGTARTHASAGDSNATAIIESDFNDWKEQLRLLRRVREQQTKQYDDLAAKFNTPPPLAPTGPAGRTITAIKADLKKANDDFEKSVVGSKEYNDLRTKIQNLNKELQAADAKDPKVKEPRASRLTAGQKDAFKDIDAIRDQDLAEQQLQRSKNLIDEETYLTNILAINQAAIQEKLGLIKGANAEERKQIAELRLDKINEERETNDKIFAGRKEALEKTLADEIAAIQRRDKAIQDDPTSSATAKAQAKLDSDREILRLQESFMTDMDRLEKELGQQSLTNTKAAGDAVTKTKQEILDDQRLLDEAALVDAKARGEKAIADFKKVISDARVGILSGGGSVNAQSRATTALDRQEKLGVLAREVTSMQEQLPIYKNLLAQKRITDTEYLTFVTELNNKIKELADLTGTSLENAEERITTVQGFIQSKLRELLNFKLGGDNDKLLGQAISESYALATAALHNHFDAERARINESLELAQTRLDKEKEQRLAQASSMAEREAIEKQFAERKRRADLEAGEQLKKTKRAEARIAFVTELANIAVAAAGNPANAVTFGASGAIMYGILAAIAAGRFALNIAAINREKFAFGGSPDQVPTRGGEFGGKPHSEGGTPFEYRGRAYEAEVKELAVIRTRDAIKNKVITVTGTQMQIASSINEFGGGRRFSPGGKIRTFDYGGSLGQSLQAPVYIPSGGNSTFINNNTEMVEEIKGMREDLLSVADEQSKRIDRLEVVQTTSSVTRAQQKEVKQSSIGTL